MRALAEDELLGPEKAWERTRSVLATEVKPEEAKIMAISTNW